MQHTHEVEGNLAKDPTRRYLDDGTPVCNLRVIYNTRRRVDGEWRDGTPVTYDIACWGDLAERVFAGVRKGDLVLVNLRPDIKLRVYEGKAYVGYTAENVALSLRWHAATSSRPRKAADGDTVQTAHGEVFPADELADAVPVPA